MKIAHKVALCLAITLTLYPSLLPMQGEQTPGQRLSDMRWKARFLRSEIKLHPTRVEELHHDTEAASASIEAATTDIKNAQEQINELQNKILLEQKRIIFNSDNELRLNTQKEENAALLPVLAQGLGILRKEKSTLAVFSDREIAVYESEKNGVGEITAKTMRGQGAHFMHRDNEGWDIKRRNPYFVTRNTCADLMRSLDDHLQTRHAIIHQAAPLTKDRGANAILLGQDFEKLHKLNNAYRPSGHLTEKEQIIFNQKEQAALEQRELEAAELAKLVLMQAELEKAKLLRIAAQQREEELTQSAAAAELSEASGSASRRNSLANISTLGTASESEQPQDSAVVVDASDALAPKKTSVSSTWNYAKSLLQRQ